jgi:hypothetical protein
MDKTWWSKESLNAQSNLKTAKEIKASIKFKNVSISADLSVRQRSKLKKLNFIKKELNDKLNNSLFQVNYYCGIRNNKIIKIRKDINIEIDTTKFENNKKANNNLVKMVLVNFSFTKAINKELSTNDSETDLTNKLEN